MQNELEKCVFAGRLGSFFPLHFYISVSNIHTLVSRKLPAQLQSQLTSSTDYENSLATLALTGKEMKFSQ